MFVPLQFHLWRFALHTGVQCCNTNALQQWSGQIALFTAQCCSATRAHSMLCVTAVTPVEICSSYRCAVLQNQCTAAVVRANCILHCSVLLCNTGSQHALCHCNYTCGDLLFLEVCSAATPKHCSTGQGKLHSPLFSAVLQNMLTADLCHCNCA